MGVSCRGLAKCRVACGHRQIVERYYEMRDDQEVRAEDASLGYPTELKEFYDRELRVTFKRYLTGDVRV